jgi:hypothetical protein
MRWAGHVAGMEDRRGGYRDFVGKTGRDHLEHLGVENINNTIKMYLKSIWRVDGIVLVQDRDRWRAVVNAVTNLRVP